MFRVCTCFVAQRVVPLTTPDTMKCVPDKARCVPFSFLPEKHGMICNYVVFLELTHPSEVRTLVDVTVDPDG